VTNYEHATREAYRSPERAASYKRYHTEAWSWARAATWLEQRAIRRLLAYRAWQSGEVILDIPCGTGILGATLRTLPVHVVASDISPAMMALARGEYPEERFRGFVQADITAVPFADARFDGVLALGFLHRVPAHVRRGALAEIRRVCHRLALVSFSLTSPVQRLKQRTLRSIRARHVPAPCAIARAQAELEIRAAGFHILRRVSVAPLLSAESLYLLAADRAPEISTS
jgi:SAM-dependent methyltransferase